MDGLEKITQKILYDSKQKCDALIDEAQTHAQELTEKNLESANKEAQEIEKSAEKEIQRISESAVSTCESIRKRAVLNARCDVIDGWIEKAKKHVETLKRDEYFEFISSVAIKHHSPGEGVLLMRGEDIADLPDNFLDNINSKIDSDGSRFTKIEEADIGAGCVISYGDIEENCTVEALFDDKNDEIKDLLFSFFK